MFSGRRPSTPAAGSERTLSVAELNRQARLLLEGELGELWVEGEISGLSRPSSGHVYFTLKDDRAQVRCALFRNRARFVGAPMREGDLIRVRAKISIFEPRGDYQLIVEAVQGAGRGAMLAALEALKQRLQDEGVFANERALPYPPRHLGIITSGTGAAIRDVLAVLGERWPAINVSVLPVPVQGSEASGAIIRAIALANRDGRFDALLITRGGGSLEDLWSFNDEHLARAIFHSRLPVMSAVGHEVDFTLADFAADVRAPTPSAAAERLVPDQHDIQSRLDTLTQRLSRAQRHLLDQQQQRLDHTRSRLRHPGERLLDQRRRTRELEQRMQRALRQRLGAEHRRLEHVEMRLMRQTPERRLTLAREHAEELQARLYAALPRQLRSQRERLESIARQLNAVSPLGVLGRGYAIVENSERQVVRRAQDTTPGQQLSVRLGEGRLKVEVKRRLKQ
ncbi:exodeoxyribonuclease VII large subunit [Phytohalomonas tamaricis]|uniref:exodeoxyribonuclease VII large subunit n=1 Tax=Phytohalomonas tamaricis TaxID=2081032 RepID=UPI000D0AF7CC|nr:exodeoxyribonuclease VII large subunit [Phytohalomonas tamaricis]